MKFETTVEVHLEPEELSAWNNLYLAVYDLSRKPCEDAEVIKAAKNVVKAMQDFAFYFN